MIRSDRQSRLQLRLLSGGVVLAACAFVAGHAHAQTGGTAPPTAVPEGARNDRGPLGPTLQRQGDVAYVSGGIGEVGQAQTQALGRDMNLQMVFAQRDGSYLAQVDVAVADGRGNTVLDVDASGPLLYAQLPPGRYQVTATAQGKPIRRSVEVPARGQHIERFLWSGEGQTK